MPEGEDLERLAATGATLAIHLSVRNLSFVRRALEPHYGPKCPVVVAIRVGWPDEAFIEGTLADIAAKVRAAKVTRTALILAGPALAAQGFEDSALYSADHVHVLRPGKKAKAKAVRTTDP